MKKGTAKWHLVIVVCYHKRRGHLVAYLANKIPTKDATIFIFESKRASGEMARLDFSMFKRRP